MSLFHCDTSEDYSRTRLEIGLRHPAITSTRRKLLDSEGTSTVTRREIFLGLIFCVCLVTILLYIALLQVMDLPATIFHGLFIAATTVSATIVLQHQVKTRIRLAVVVSWIVTLQLTVPLRLPGDILSNYPDAWYVKQLVDSIMGCSCYCLGCGTGQAYMYSFYPIDQLSTAVLATVTSANDTMLMKFMPVLLSTCFLLLLFGLFRNFLSDTDALLATQISGSCFWFVYFLSRPVQSAYGVLFISMILFSLKRSGSLGRMTFIMGSLGVASSHMLSAIYILILLCTAKGYMAFDKILKKRNTEVPLGSSRIAILAIIVIAWMLYPAIIASANLVDSLRFALLEIQAGSLRFALSAGATTANPTPTRIVGNIGVILYGALLLFGFLYLYLRRQSISVRGLLPYGFAAGVVWAVHVLIFSLGVTTAIDILPRGFFFVYTVGSPLAVFGLYHVSKFYVPKVVQKLTGSIAEPKHGETRVAGILAYSLIILILLSSMYYYYPAFRYDNSAPMNFEDVRLPLEQWRVVGAWASHYVAAEDLYGDKLAFSFVGAIGEKWVHVFPPEGDLLAWFRTIPAKGEIVALRMSSTYAPYEQFVTTADRLQSALESNNLVYSSGDAVLVIVR